MSRTYKDSAKGSGRDRHISVRGIRRRQPDLRRMSRALVRQALADAAAEEQVSFGQATNGQQPGPSEANE